VIIFKTLNLFHKKFFFSGISFDSSKIKKNNIFFAIKGNKIDGNDFISSAISNGAKIVVTEKKINGLKMVFYLFTQIILESY
jgi:murE/murF fusion protein